MGLGEDPVLCILWNGRLFFFDKQFFIDKEFALFVVENKIV